MKLHFFKDCIKYLFAFMAVLLLLTGFIVGVATIPRDKIKCNFLESAKYMCERRTSYLITNWIHASQMDRYADCITLSISHQLDENRPLESAMRTSFYGGYSRSMNNYLLESVQNNLKASHEYIRYWHGSAATMRFLHLFWNIKAIYIFHAVLMALLSLILIIILLKNRFRIESASYVLSMIIVSIWYVPLCLEYTYTFLCMMIASIIGLLLAVKQKCQLLGVFFMITGMVTVYFDFLTTETLTLLIPLLLILRVFRRQDKSGKELWINGLKFGATWGIGYLGMWVMKWFLASIALKENVLPYVTGHVTERINGAVSGYHITGNTYLDTLLLNLRNLFPYEYGLSGAVLVVAFIFAVIVLPVVAGHVKMRKNVRASNVLLFAAIGLVPYVRYLILHNHSYIHSFFTYRAQAATVLALCFIILDLVEPTKRKSVTSYET